MPSSKELAHPFFIFLDSNECLENSVEASTEEEIIDLTEETIDPKTDQEIIDLTKERKEDAVELSKDEQQKIIDLTTEEGDTEKNKEADSTTTIIIMRENTMYFYDTKGKKTTEPHDLYANHHIYIDLNNKEDPTYKAD